MKIAVERDVFAVIALRLQPQTVAQLPARCTATSILARQVLRWRLPKSTSLTTGRSQRGSDTANIDEQVGSCHPAWAASLLKKSDLKDASMTNDGVSVMRTVAWA